MIILWFSCGAASAVACKLALAQWPDARIVYQHIESAHADNKRFIADCEKWYGKNIEVISSPFYRDQFDVVRATRYINGPAGARCTTELKKKATGTWSGNIFPNILTKWRLSSARLGEVA